MLTITSAAQSVIRRVSAHRKLAPTSGIRVAARQDSDAPLEVCAVHGPRDGDSVVESPGGRLYLDSTAIRRVDGRALDAVTDPRGRVQFVLRNAA